MNTFESFGIFKFANLLPKMHDNEDGDKDSLVKTL